jgi:hypothetical protein
LTERQRSKDSWQDQVTAKPLLRGNSGCLARDSRRRTERKWRQEGMIGYGFSLAHWQMIEAGRPSIFFTLLAYATRSACSGVGHRLRRRRAAE